MKTLALILPLLLTSCGSTFTGSYQDWAVSIKFPPKPSGKQVVPAK